jgi:hypothetical protein
MVYEPDDEESFVVSTRGLDFTQNRARLEFLKAIRRTAPPVLTSLEQNVLPHFQALLELLIFHRLRWSQIRLWTSRRGYEKENPTLVNSLRELKQALEKWAVGWRINEDEGWLYDCALSTLGHWSHFGKTGDWDPEYEPHTFMLLLGNHFQFEFPAWDREITTWPDYQRALDAAYKKAKKEHQSRIRNKPTRSVARRTYKTEHYDWLVEYQINRKSFTLISEVHQRMPKGLDLTSVREAVIHLASLIGISPRPPGSKS